MSLASGRVIEWKLYKDAYLPRGLSIYVLFIISAS